MARNSVLVSHAASDEVVVAPFVRSLQTQGPHLSADAYVFAEEPPLVGQLADAICSSTWMLACITDAYIERESTEFELKVSLGRERGEARTILVTLRRLTRDIPDYIRHLQMYDFSDPKSYRASFERISRLLRQHPPRLPKGPPVQVDRYVQQLAETPIGNAARVYLAGSQLVRKLHLQFVGALPVDAGTEELINAIVGSNRTSEDSRSALETLRILGRQPVTAEVDARQADQAIGSLATRRSSAMGWRRGA